MATLEKIQQVIKDDVELAKARMASGARRWWNMSDRKIGYALVVAYVVAALIVVALMLCA